MGRQLEPPDERQLNGGLPRRKYEHRSGCSNRFKWVADCCPFATFVAQATVPISTKARTRQLSERLTGIGPPSAPCSVAVGSHRVTGGERNGLADAAHRQYAALHGAGRLCQWLLGNSLGLVRDGIAFSAAQMQLADLPNIVGRIPLIRVRHTNVACVE